MSDPVHQSVVSGNPIRYRLMVLAAALLFSTGGVAIKSTVLERWQVAGFRSGIAAVALLLLVPESRKGWNRITLAAGVAYAATLVSFVAANKLTTSANAIFLQSTAPIYMLFLSPLVLKERIRKQDVAVVAAVACGALLLLRGSAAEPGSGAAAGNWIALFSGFAWAWTMTALRWAGSQGSTGTNGVSVAALGNLIAFVGCLPMAWWETARPAPVDLAVLLYLGVFQIALAYLCLSRSLRHVRAIEAATILLVEPVLNPVWSWLFRNERPSPAALAGGTMIIFSAFCGTWLQSRNK